MWLLQLRLQTYRVAVLLGNARGFELMCTLNDCADLEKLGQAFTFVLRALVETFRIQELAHFDELQITFGGGCELAL